MLGADRNCSDVTIGERDDIRMSLSQDRHLVHVVLEEWQVFAVTEGGRIVSGPAFNPLRVVS